MTPTRPNPDYLLHRVEEEERQGRLGKLKIYLGAAPGVGKTHEMLHDAFERRQQGLDVLIGIAESHGREEIEQFLQNFEILPRQAVPYRDKTYYEFDLDAALQRHPGLILVDELAHTNTPGLRHNKRWQDIKELLDRGIDVYTTVNVQHIESLKDSVAQIIQAPVSETVPDSIIERANTIELIDLPPEDLLKRLQEGKVYIPQQAEFAREHFFRKGNLIALRELALRVTAERVGTDVLWYRQGEGIKEIWPVKDKILVCVGPNPETLKLIRAAKKLASTLQTEWLAVYIDVPQAPEIRNQAIQNLRLAEHLGAQTRVLSGFNIVKEILDFAHEQNVTQIMIWKQIRIRFRDWFYRSLTDEIVRQSGDIDVYIMTGQTTKTIAKKPPPKSIPWNLYGSAFAIVSVITAVNLLLSPLLASSNLIMIYLLGVTVIALFAQRGPSLFASILSVFAYDFFFIPPRFSFSLTDIEYILTLLIMLSVAQVISYLTILIRHQAESARFAQHQTTALYAFSRQLIRTRSMNKLLTFSVGHLAHIFNSAVLALIPKKGRLEIQASQPTAMNLDEKEYSIAQWVFDMGQPAGLGTDTLSLSQALYLPLHGPSEIMGVIRIQPQEQSLFTPEQRNLLESYINQISLALEIDFLHEKARMNELELEKDRARTSLLASIYHDLCFPLRSVINAINKLKHLNEKNSQLIASNIDHEINKLDRLNNNLYQMIQLESEGIELKKTSSSVKEMINTAIKISSETFEKRPIQLNVADNLPQVTLDPKYIQEVLIHLLDNAIKFSVPKSHIQLVVHIKEEQLMVSIEDCGLEIASEERKKLFKKFYRSKEALEEHGLGLGLAICEKIISAHGGTIWVEQIANKRTAFRFTLPINSKD